MGCMAPGESKRRRGSRLSVAGVAHDDAGNEWRMANVASLTCRRRCDASFVAVDPFLLQRSAAWAARVTEKSLKKSLEGGD
jgi:hypothetical protein